MCIYPFFFFFPFFILTAFFSCMCVTSCPFTVRMSTWRVFITPVLKDEMERRVRETVEGMYLGIDLILHNL